MKPISSIQPRCRSRRARRSIAGALLLLAGLTPAPAQSGRERAPATGLFLVADESLRDPNFRHAVVLILQHGDAGTLGVVVNRPTEERAAGLLPEVPELEGSDLRAWSGGPVAPGVVVAVVASKDQPGDDARPVLDGVWVVPSKDDLGALLRADLPPSSWRFFTGHAGWAAGQLDFEIALGSWRVVPASAAQVFTDRPHRLWEELTDIARLPIARLPLPPRGNTGEYAG